MGANDVYHLDWVRQKAEYFTYMISFTLPDIPVKYVLQTYGSRI